MAAEEGGRAMVNVNVNTVVVIVNDGRSSLSGRNMMMIAAIVIIG